MLSMMSTAACCAIAAGAAAAGAAGAWHFFKKTPEPAVRPPPVEADIERELAIGLASMIAAVELANQPTIDDATALALAAQAAGIPIAVPDPRGVFVVLARARADRGEFAELLALTHRWRELGGKPKNTGQFNDLMRALEAIRG